jgi:predicted nucleic acid-binding protein
MATTQQSGSTAVIDERRGRRVATSLGVPVVGTFGLILEAKRRGEIPAARPVIEHLLRVTNWYLSPRTMQGALRGVGEY